MNVSTMISLMRTIGIGEVFNDDDSDAIALNFLNLANDELYRETANINCDLFLYPTITSIAGQSTVTLPKNPFTVLQVFPVGFKFPLKPLSLIEMAKYKFHNPSAANPIFFNNSGAIVNFYPIIPTVSYNLNIWYTPERTLLEKNTAEEDVPYPVSYQSVLVDGALYYLFQDESGFKNPQKENEALRRWIKGKADLKSFLYGANKQLISTFRNA